MRNDMMGIIFTDNVGASMGELTTVRSLAAVPFGGRYRIIDFMLSNMVNSSMTTVGITTPYNYQSLSDHLGTGKPWDLDRKSNGLFLLPPKDISTPGAVKGGIDTINGISHFLIKSRKEYVVVSDCNTICKVDFGDVMKFHTENDADITVLCSEVGLLDSRTLASRILFDIDESDRIRDIQAYPLTQKSNYAYMHAFLIKKGLLLDLIGDAAAHNKHHISRDIFMPNLDRLKIFGYKYKGFCRQIDTIKAFYDANLELLNKDVRDELFGGNGGAPVYTKVKDTVPTKYGIGADVSNSFIADGCRIEGTVKNSILFRGVHVGAGATVENCIVMQNSEVMENCLLENVIFDKEVILRGGRKLVGQDTYPMVVGKKTVI